MQIKFEQVPSEKDTSFYCYTKSSAEYSFDMHFHPEYELVYFAKGDGRAYAMDSVMDYDEGDVFLFGSNVPHTFVSNSSINEAIVIQFTHDFLGEGFWENKDVKNIKHLLTASNRGLVFRADAILELMEELTPIPNKTGLSRIFKLLHALDFLSMRERVELLTLPQSLNLSRQSDLLLKVFNYLHRNLTEEISVLKVSEIMGMSRSGFEKYFKRATQRPFNDYVIDLRIYKACDKLINTESSILEICYQSGFGNLSNFNRQFRKRKKMTPRQYRKAFA